MGTAKPSSAGQQGHKQVSELPLNSKQPLLQVDNSRPLDSAWTQGKKTERAVPQKISQQSYVIHCGYSNGPSMRNVQGVCRLWQVHANMT